MKIKMSEYFQGRGVSALLLPRRNRVSVLEPGQEYEVDDSLAEFLLKARKAEVAQDFRHLDVEPQFEQAEVPPQLAPRKRGRRQ